MEASLGMARLTVRIDFGGEAGAVGPGKVKLLELVEREGSIRKAAMAMDMSYRQAWLLVQALEESFGQPLVATATGGAKGGGAKLTSLGEAVLARYRAIEKRAAGATAAELKALENLAKGAHPEHRSLRPRRK